MAVVHRWILFRGFSIKIAIKFDLARLRLAVVARWPLPQVWLYSQTCVQQLPLELKKVAVVKRWSLFTVYSYYISSGEDGDVVGLGLPFSTESEKESE